MTLAEQGAGVTDGGCHREELHDDVHAAEEEPLLALEPRLIHQDAVEALAGEFPTTALDEPEMRRERAEIAVAKRRGQPIEPERWIPARVEARDFRKGSQAHTKRCPRIGDGTGNLEMLVHSLPRHE